MRRIIVSVLLVLMLFALCACQEEVPDFDAAGCIRGMAWGDSMETVKNKETAEFTEETEMENSYQLKYQLEEFAGLDEGDVDVMYVFPKEEDGLVALGVTYTIEDTGKARSVYNELKDAYTALYGEGTEYDYAAIGYSIASIAWEKSDVTISISCFGGVVQTYHEHL